MDLFRYLRLPRIIVRTLVRYCKDGFSEIGICSFRSPQIVGSIGNRMEHRSPARFRVIPNDASARVTPFRNDATTDPQQENSLSLRNRATVKRCERDFFAKGATSDVCTERRENNPGIGDEPAII